jgi:hypothetical protein
MSAAKSNWSALIRELEAASPGFEGIGVWHYSELEVILLCRVWLRDGPLTIYNVLTLHLLLHCIDYFLTF